LSSLCKAFIYKKEYIFIFIYIKRLSDSFTSFQWKIEETKEKKNKPEFLEYILLTIIALFLIALTSIMSIAIFNMITDNRPPDKPIKYIQYQSKAK
jgi:formate/nitrite transporter FocA (FNT family)